MGTYSVNPKFEKWAKGLTGMDGGNPDGHIWICGIEYGGNNDENDFADLRTEIDNFDENKVPFISEKMRNSEKYFNNTLKPQFSQKVAKIVCEYLNTEIHWYDYLQKEICSQSGALFKLNLYPLSFKDTNDLQWTEEHFDITGFPNKLMYKAWCMNNRFKILRNKLEQYSPKVLICVGINHKSDYQMAFADNIAHIFQKLEPKQLESGKTIYYAKINNKKTLLIITPFLGQGGLMSDADLIGLGKFAREQAEL